MTPTDASADNDRKAAGGDTQPTMEEKKDEDDEQTANARPHSPVAGATTTTGTLPGTPTAQKTPILKQTHELAHNLFQKISNSGIRYKNCPEFTLHSYNTVIYIPIPTTF